MATVAHALTSKEIVKKRLVNVAADDDSFDDLIDSLINAATDILEKLCGDRRFLETTYTQEIYDGYNSDGSPKGTLLLKNYPVSAVSSFQYRSTHTSTTWTDFSAADYVTDLASGIIRSVGGRFPSGFRVLRITYTAGYKIDFDNILDTAQHTLPFDLMDAATNLVVRKFKTRDHFGKTSISEGGGTINLAKDIDPEIMQVVQKYMKLEV